MMSEIESMMGLPSTSNEQANQPDPAPASASTAQPSRAVEESGSTAEGSAPAGPSDSGNDNAPMEVDAGMLIRSLSLLLLGERTQFVGYIKSRSSECWSLIFTIFLVGSCFSGTYYWFCIIMPFL